MDKINVLLKALEMYCYGLVSVRRKYIRGRASLDDVLFELSRCMDGISSLYTETPYPVYEFLSVMRKALGMRNKQKLVDVLDMEFSRMLREQGVPRTICTRIHMFPYDVICRYLGYQVKKNK